MMDDVLAGYGGRFLLATAIVSVALIVFVGMLWVLKRRTPTSFVRVKKNRKSRLQVLDHTAVDTRRQLLLIRRDDVEHLIMIGGPTDIVIESGIGNPLSAREGQNAGTFENPSAADSFETNARPLAPPPVPVVPVPRSPNETKVGLRQADEMEKGLDEAVSVLRSEAALSRHQGQGHGTGSTMRDAAMTGPEATAAPAPARADDATMSLPPMQPPAARRDPPVDVEPMGRVAYTPPPAKTILTGTGSIFEHEAEDALERARQRIMKPSPRPESGANRNGTVPAATRSAIPDPMARSATETRAPYTENRPESPSPASPAPDMQPIHSDFERILQAEMDHLGSLPDTADSPSSAPAPQVRPNPAPPITGVSRDEQILQNEIAKIFGEMTFDRKKP